mmetsp:Transcript_63096/g.159762  ORF Transcript_63096/g.159762 Transcript_63096/m.159762 type:complete len:131 (+) Transcript_63096:1-393(+)
MCSLELDSCYYLGIPGLVQDEEVSSQACILQDQKNSTEPQCLLWNGTLVDPCSYVPCDGGNQLPGPMPVASDETSPPPVAGDVAGDSGPSRIGGQAPTPMVDENGRETEAAPISPQPQVPQAVPPEPSQR